MTHIMTENRRSNLAATNASEKWVEKSDEEQRLIKLLSLVS